MLKKIGKIILLVLILAVGFAVGLTAKYYLDEWRARRNVALWMQSLTAPYENDTYGGKTPEETFDMYLAALKKGDLELASKYFWVERRKGQLEDLRGLKSDELNSYIKKLELMPNVWQPKQSENKELAKFLYVEKLEKNTVANLLGKQVFIPAGNYGRTIEFAKLNNIWKIDDL